MKSAWLTPVFASRRVRLALGWLALLFAQLLLWRAVFVVHFYQAVGVGDLCSALWLGIRFDLRLTLMLLVPVLLPLALPVRFTALHRPWLHWFSLLWIFVVTTLIHLTAMIDIGHFSYVTARLNATVFGMVKDFAISGEMMLQSYPVGWLCLLLAVLSVGGWWLSRWWLWRQTCRQALTPAPRWPVQVGTGFALTLCAAAGIYGNASFYPLRWSQAFSTSNPYLIAVSLNPALFLLDTMSVRGMTFDREKTIATWPVIAQRLGLPANLAPGQDPQFARWTPPVTVVSEAVVSELAGAEPTRTKPAKQWNIVSVQLETQAAHWLASHGNSLRPTPYLDRIESESISFSTTYAPAYGTARTVWAFFSSIPDVSQIKTATRNPLIADQHSVAMAFTGYDHLYFLGGSANWANIRAFLQQSLPGLHIWEEGDYPGEQRIDVWGVSDLTLLQRAHRELEARDRSKPFFCQIQTSGNHRPYTIPDKNAGFTLRHAAPETLTDAGLSDNDQYNAVRLIDHFIGTWLEEVKKGSYINDTIFVFYGDHGTSCPQTPGMGADFALNLVPLRIPLFIWSPGLKLSPRRIDTPASIVDILPTVAALAGVPVLNTTMGQNLLAPDLNPNRSVFMLVDAGGSMEMGGRNRDFFLRTNAEGSKVTLHDLHSATPQIDVSAAHPAERERLQAETEAMFRASQWMMYHNRRRDHAPLDPTPVVPVGPVVVPSPISSTGGAAADKP